MTRFDESQNRGWKPLPPFHPEETTADATLRGKDLTICDVVRVARFGAKIQLTTVSEILRRVEKAHRYITTVVSAGKPIYGVTTGFGGMGHTIISPEDAGELQENLIWLPLHCSLRLHPRSR